MLVPLLGTETDSTDDLLRSTCDSGSTNIIPKTYTRILLFLLFYYYHIYLYFLSVPLLLLATYMVLAVSFMILFMKTRYYRHEAENTKIKDKDTESVQ